MTAIYTPPGPGQAAIVTGIENYRAAKADAAADRATRQLLAEMGAAALPTIALTVSPSTVAENATNKDITFTATLSAPVLKDTAIALTWGGTAARPADVTVPAGPLTIPAGRTTVTAVATVVDDAGAESNETLSLTIAATISGLSLSATAGGSLTATATITSNE